MAIVDSEFISESFKIQRHLFDDDPPSCEKTARAMLFQFYDERKHELTAFCKKEISKGVRFSLTLDEYTDSANKRYLNLNVHNESKHWPLGLYLY